MSFTSPIAIFLGCFTVWVHYLILLVGTHVKPSPKLVSEKLLGSLLRFLGLT